MKILLISLFLIAYANPAMTQWEDTRRDNLPLEFANHYGGEVRTDAIPININGFDNFFLGTDFAEAHISENPMKPGEYFIAFNTNNTYYTLNGYNWQTNNPNFGAVMRGDPLTAYDSLGRLYYENMYGSPNVLGTKIIASTNNGANWFSPVNGNTGADKNWLTAVQTAGPYSNYLYSTMTTGDFAGLNFIRSTDNGSTFSAPIKFVFTPLPGSMTCIGPNGSTQGGTVYLVGNSSNSFASVYLFYKSTNGGESFTQVSAQNFSNYVGTDVDGRHSVQNMRTRPYPYIACDNSYGTYRGRLYCVYASNNPSGNGNKPDIFCRYSTNGALTWSSPVVVNDDINSQDNYQWHPAIWCDKTTGRLYIQWMDTRDTPTGDSALIYATYTNNGGQTFQVNQKISNKKMKIDCETCPGGGVPRYQGDYNGIVSNSKTAMLAWADFRNGDFGSYAAYFPDFAMTVTPETAGISSGGNPEDYEVKIPDVKLFSDAATFTASVSPSPVTGTISITFPFGNAISSFPGVITMRVEASQEVPEALYTITVTGKGSNGTPVHKRTVTLNVTSALGISNTEIPVRYELLQNYPNPFNPSTTIEYSIISQSSVKLTFYDMLGKVVSKYEVDDQKPGSYSVIFDSRNLPSGVYYYKLEAGGFTDIKKMILLK